jgi:osmotically inducible lipoprotein OsmB
MRTFANIVGALALTAMLSACGSSTSDRALSGAGIGAAGGAAAGAVTGGNPVTGAILGGAAGAAVGGLTNKDDLDLGKPIWK